VSTELERRESNLDRLERFFRSQPGIWIPARDFEDVAGRQAWRSRIAECRTKRGMVIENREDRDRSGRIVASWYRYLEHEPIGRAAETRVDGLLFDVHRRNG
jgi:hypothetical protein